MNVNKWTTAHLLVYSANVVRLSSDFFIRFDMRKVGESHDNWSMAIASTLLHTCMYLIADVSRHVIIHGTTGCDPNTCKLNINSRFYLPKNIHACSI